MGTPGRNAVAERLGNDFVRCQINSNCLVAFPIRRYLQNRGTAQPAVGEEQFLPEPCFIALRYNLGRDSCEIAKAFVIFGMKYDRDQSRPRITNSYPELPRQFISEGSCAHLRYGKASGRDDERRSTILSMIRAH